MQHFELSDGASHKFWSIAVSGDSFTVRYGRIGTAGREQVKKFDSAARSAQEAKALIAAKVNKGYVEVRAEGFGAMEASTKTVGHAVVLPVRMLGLDDSDVPFFEAVADSALLYVPAGIDRSRMWEGAESALSAEDEGTFAKAVGARAREVFGALYWPEYKRLLRGGEHALIAHGVPAKVQVERLRALGLGVMVHASAEVAEALELAGPDPVIPATSDEAQLTEQAVDDIFEWFRDHDIPLGLRAPAFGALRVVEERLGAPLPEALRRLYARHDGQADPDGTGLFAHGGGVLNPLLVGLRDTRDELEHYLGFDPKVGVMDVEGHYGAEKVLLEKERNGRWFWFASMSHFALFCHLDTGRVVRGIKGDPMEMLGSFDVFLREYASALWNDGYAVERGMGHDGNRTWVMPSR